MKWYNMKLHEDLRFLMLWVEEKPGSTKICPQRLFNTQEEPELRKQIWIELEWRNPGLNGYAWNVFTYKWVLAAKYSITMLQSTDPKKQSNKEGPGEDVWILLRRGDKVIKDGWRERTRRERGGERGRGRSQGWSNIGSTGEETKQKSSLESRLFQKFMWKPIIVEAS